MHQQSVHIQLPSRPMQAIYNTIQAIGGSNIPFLITGETGVGKEAVARYIHESGPRRDHPFITINAERFTAELLQSERLGDETDGLMQAMRQYQSAFEKADGGVLFFDEVAEMSLEAQEKLLYVLDTAKFTPLGGSEALRVNVHIIAATQKNLIEAIVEKQFRKDLYYRLNSLMLHIPPLRERREDIAPLVEAFMNEFRVAYGKNVTGITSKALKRLEQAAWLGNIRELRSIVQMAIALATTEILKPKDFPSIYPELAGTLSSIWQILPLETQDAIWDTLTTIEDMDTLNIGDMDQNQILHKVAQKRIEKHRTLREAAESLSIDIRTLRKYAAIKGETPK